MATSLQDEVARLGQALEDLSACQGAGVALVRCSSRSRERGLIRALVGEAHGRGFCTATVSLVEHTLDSPEGLVRAVIESLAPPGESRARGMLWVLERFYDLYGSESAELFAAACGRLDAVGDLTELCRWYLSTDEPEPEPQIRAYQSWLAGEEPPKKFRNPEVRRVLNERTAQRVLSELSRIILALGHRGLVVFLSGGDALAERTDRQREKAYTVLRELVDNFDAVGGALATRIVITGGDPLFDGDNSIQSIAPLHMRLQVPSEASPAPPHRSSTTVDGTSKSARHRKVTAWDKRSSVLSNLIRISEGLPPVTGVTRMSVGQERLDNTIRRLFEIVGRSGSFFSALVGEYGSGKTHLMMHLAERALEDNRPVFWLNLERTNLDLGNPARHLVRFLEHSQMPMRGQPSALEVAHRWTRSPSKARSLMATIDELAAGEGEAAKAAQKAQRLVGDATEPGAVLEGYLSGIDLVDRPGDATYRTDAYRRIFLWLELLARNEGVRGPVVLIDEAENLYTSGRSPASRRTSLRSLAFYCGGALPGTCVILGMTPPAFEELKNEARDLLADAAEMETTLDLENVDKFRRSLWGIKPEAVKPLKRAERLELCERVRKMHRSVRGSVEFPEWDAYAAKEVAAHPSPRTLIRSVVDHLESAWWAR